MNWTDTTHEQKQHDAWPRPATLQPTALTWHTNRASSHNWNACSKAMWSLHRVPARFLWTQSRRRRSIDVTNGSEKVVLAAIVHSASPQLHTRHTFACVEKAEHAHDSNNKLFMQWCCILSCSARSEETLRQQQTLWIKLTGNHNYSIITVLLELNILENASVDDHFSKSWFNWKASQKTTKRSQFVIGIESFHLWLAHTHTHTHAHTSHTRNVNSVNAAYSLSTSICHLWFTITGQWLQDSKWSCLQEMTKKNHKHQLCL